MLSLSVFDCYFFLFCINFILHPDFVFVVFLHLYSTRNVFWVCIVALCFTSGLLMKQLLTILILFSPLSVSKYLNGSLLPKKRADFEVMNLYFIIHFLTQLQKIAKS